MDSEGIDQGNSEQHSCTDVADGDLGLYTLPKEELHIHMIEGIGSKEHHGSDVVPDLCILVAGEGRQVVEKRLSVGRHTTPQRNHGLQSRSLMSYLAYADAHQCLSG